jgi:predicted alpha/beta superfamily hydrolase
VIFTVVNTISLYAQEDFDNITFGKYRYVHSEIMGEDRQLYVYLPDDYKSSNESYPVVFQLYSHFMHNYYLPAIRTADLMGSNGQAPKMIVVGIKNQEFRYRDLLPEDHWGGKSEIDIFLKFFETELIPFTEENYRVNEYRILSAPQAGAAFGIYAMSVKPNLFNAFFLTSPFWVESSRETLLSKFADAVEQNDYSKKFIMLSYGKYESGEELEAITRFKNLMNKIVSPSFEFYENLLDPDFGFSTPIDFEKGMKQLFKEYKFPGKDRAQDLAAIISYYEELSKQMEMPIKIPEHALVFEGDKFVQENELDKALEIFKKMNELYPEGLMGYDRIGDVYFRKGMYVASLKYYQMFLEKQPKNPRILNKVAAIREEIDKEN